MLKKRGLTKVLAYRFVHLFQKENKVYRNISVTLFAFLRDKVLLLYMFIEIGLFDILAKLHIQTSFYL